MSTKEVYEAFDSLTEVVHPNIKKLTDSLGKEDLRYIVKLLGNVLEDVTIKKHGIIDEIKRLLLENGAVFSMMTGSGPTVFGIFENKEKAVMAGERLSEMKCFELVEVTRCQGLE